jgi:dihydroorotate dehydrogenase
MKPLIVSAPFGNYHRFLTKVTGTDFTPTLGTFTWEPRGFWVKPYGGRFIRLLLSLRYSPIFKSWVNKIGLKNPGIRWCRDQVVAGKIDPTDKIISIYGWTIPEWEMLIDCVCDIKPYAVEINASCPNVHRPPFDQHVLEKVVQRHSRTIVKIPPVDFMPVVEMAYRAGVRIFHATNTLPTPRGGMSGKALLPISLAAVRSLRSLYSDIIIIGGGGITTPENATDYFAAGANHVSIGTMLFNPRNWGAVKKVALAAESGTNLLNVL